MSSKSTNQDPFHSAGKPPPSSADQQRPLQPPLWWESYKNKNNTAPRKNVCNETSRRSGWGSFWNATAASALPSSFSFSSCLLFKAGLGVTVALYILNQNHLLPRPLSSCVSKALFLPTMPITVARRLGKWVTVIDDTVVMGGAPFGFAKLPEKLYEQYGVSAQC